MLVRTQVGHEPVEYSIRTENKKHISLRQVYTSKRKPVHCVRFAQIVAVRLVQANVSG